MKTERSTNVPVIILMVVISLLLGAILGVLIFKGKEPVTTEAGNGSPENEGKVFDGSNRAKYEKFDLGLEMVRIPGQTFLMGNYDENPEGTEDELPAHSVNVDPFIIGKFEITQKQYEKVMGTFPSYFKGENKPVTNVTWYDAILFCNALSRKEGLQESYNVEYGPDGSAANVSWNRAANGYRLPTEAEHECAAQFAFHGQPLDATLYGWFLANGAKSIHNVGQKLPNKYSLFDIIGNVWEWCWDVFGPFDVNSQNYPTGPASGAERVAKGGSYTSDNTLVRSSDRGHGKPTLKGRDLGFRVARNK